VLWNLLDNAVKYSPGINGLGYIGKRRRLCCGLVKDSGLGIPAGEQKEIFRKLSAEIWQKDKYPGTGIGLSIALMIVEAHGGKSKSRVRRDKKHIPRGAAGGGVRSWPGYLLWRTSPA